MEKDFGPRGSFKERLLLYGHLRILQANLTARPLGMGMKCPGRVLRGAQEGTTPGKFCKHCSRDFVITNDKSLVEAVAICS